MNPSEVLDRLNLIERISQSYPKLRAIATVALRELEDYAESVKSHEEQASRPIYGDPVKVIRKPEEPIAEDEVEEDDEEIAPPPPAVRTPPVTRRT